MSSRRSGQAVGTSKAAPATPKKKRGRPPGLTNKNVQILQETASKKNNEKHKFQSPKKASASSSTFSADEVDVTVTDMSVRRSSRDRSVKSARELLGLIPSDQIKQEKEEQAAITAKERSVKPALKEVSEVIVKPYSVAQSPGRSTKQTEARRTRKVIKLAQEDKDEGDETEEMEIDTTTVDEGSPGKKATVKWPDAEDIDSVPSSSETGSEEAITIEVPRELPTDVAPDKATPLNKYTIKKDSGTASVKIVSESGKTESEKNSSDEVPESFEGLVDPETGLIIADGMGEHPGIQIVHTAEMTPAGDQTVFIPNEDGTAMTLHTLTNEAGEQEYYVVSNEQLMQTDNSAKVDISIAGKDEDASKVLQSLQQTDISLVETSLSSMQPVDATSSICSIEIVDARKHRAASPSGLVSTVADTTPTTIIKDLPLVAPPTAVRDRRLMNKSNFSITPMTSDELMAAPVGKNGRCVPQKQVVVAPELQDIMNNLKESDSIENHLIALSSHESTRNKYACIHCREDIPNRHFFRRHMTTKHKELDYKPWKCPLCDYKAIIKASIARHINVHSDMKPYKCLECGKGFTFRQKLQVHMKYHNDQRDHRCVLCEMAFHELKTLKTHLQKIHGIEKPKKFVDKYRGKPLTSVLVQLDDTAQPTQGFILPKEPSSTPKKSGLSTPVKELSHSQLLQKQLEAQAHALDAKQRQILEQQQQEQQLQLQLQQQHEQQQIQVVEEPEHDSVVEIQLDTTDKEEAERVKNLLDGWQIEKPESEEPQPQVEIRICSELPAGEEGQDPATVGADTMEMCHTEAPEEVVESAQDAGSDCDEVNVLLPRLKRSSTYGTRKTQLRTSRFRLGLEGNYTPIKYPVTPMVTPMQELPSQLEEEEEEEDNEEGEEEEEEEEDAEVKEEDAESKQAITSIHPKTGREVRIINNQKIVTENQIEDELKKYCVVDTMSPLSRIIFTCTLCPSSTPDEEESLGEEKQPHNQFYSKTQFCAHLEVQHPEVKPWLCVTCGYKCRMRSSLLAHNKSHQPVKKHACNICQKRFLFKQKLNVHMRSHVNLRLHQCPQCDKRFNETCDVTRHVKRVHSSRVPMHECEQCNRTFRDEESLNRHLDTHDPHKRYLCHYCNQYYRSKGSLAQHMKSHTCMFHCEICRKNFGSYSGFMAHKVMHDQSFEGFECDECGKRLHTKGSFTRHKMVAHSNVRPFSCTECSKSFKTKKDLKNHGAVHSHVRAYSCSECPFTCKRLESLKIHARRHTDVKPYQCGLCGKQYTQRSSLEGHLKHHTGQPEVTCKMCKRDFTSRYLLRKHFQTVHLSGVPANSEEIVNALRMGGEDGVTVYMCEECNSVFLSQDDLAVHILSEHMKQGFSADETPTPLPGLTVNELPLDTGLPSSGLSEHGFDTDSQGGIREETIMDTDAASSGIGEQMHYITVDNPRSDGGTKVVSLVHPPATQTLELGGDGGGGDQTDFSAPQIYMGEDGQFSIELKQETNDETTTETGAGQSSSATTSMVTMTGPSTNDVVLPMATSALDALLAVGVEQGQQQQQEQETETVVETVVEDVSCGQVAETVEVQD